MTFLVDTNVLSELARRAPDPGVLAWAARVSRVAVSVVTIEEVLYGLSWRPNPRIEAWFEAFFADRCDVLPVTATIAARSGQMRGTLQARGLVRTQADMLIAATASEHARVLVTRNARDFEGLGLPLLDPFER